MSLKNKNSNSETSQAIATHGFFNAASQEEKDLTRLDFILERQYTIIQKKSATIDEDRTPTFDNIK